MKTKSAILLCITLLVLSGCTERSEPAATKCSLCGMDPSQSKARFLVEFTDGTRFDTCSGHCAAMLAAEQTAELYRVRVFAWDTGEMIDGREASFVLGADIIPDGSMAPAVFALSTVEAAQTFVDQHGGRTAGLDQVWALAKQKEGQSG